MVPDNVSECAVVVRGRPGPGGRNVMVAPLAEVLDRAAAVLGELREVDLDGLAGDTLSDGVLALQGPEQRGDMGPVEVPRGPGRLDGPQDNGRYGCAFHNRWRTTHPDPDDDPDGHPFPPLV